MCEGKGQYLQQYKMGSENKGKLTKICIHLHETVSYIYFLKDGLGQKNTGRRRKHPARRCMEGSQCYELPACPSQLYTYPIPRIPVLVSHELSKSEFAFNRQNPDLLMDREQISQQFFPISHGKRTGLPDFSI